MIVDSERLLQYAELVAFANKIKAKIALKGDKADLDSVTTGLASLVEALAAEVQRATAAENTKANSADVYTKTAVNDLLALKADLTALQSEATTRGNEDTRLAGLIGANSTAITDATTTLQAAITAAINTCKSYTDSQVVGSTKWMGVCTYANLPTNPNKGEFWTISDQKNAEYIWTGSEWANIGADVDFTAILQDIANNATAIANETTRAKAAEATLQSNIDNKADASSVYTKTQSDARFQAIGSYLTEIADGSITTAKLASSAVTTAKLADGSVTTAKLADTAVTTAKIKDANVTNAKLAVDAVGTSNIKDGNVTESKLASALATTINGKADDSGVVHLTGAETISGIKTFRSQVMLGYIDGVLRGDEISGNIRRLFLRNFNYNDSSYYSNFNVANYADGSAVFEFGNNNGVFARVGASSATTNVIASGNNIIPTGGAVYDWAVAQLATKANASAVVTLTGDQTITGSKTFSNGFLIGNYGTFMASGEVNGDIRRCLIRVYDKGDSSKFANLQVAQVGSDGYAELSLTNKSGYVAAIREGYSNTASKSIYNGSVIVPTGSAVYNYINTNTRWRWVDVGSLTAKKGIKYSTGAEGVSSDGYYSTSYIAVTASTSIRVKMARVASGTNWGIAFYNSSKTYISGVICATGSAVAMTEQSFTTPANTAYMRFTVAPNYATLGYPYVFVAETTSVSDYIAEDSEVGYVTEQMIDDLFNDW